MARTSRLADWFTPEPPEERGCFREGCVCLILPGPQGLEQRLARAKRRECISRKKEGKASSGELRKDFSEGMRQTSFDLAPGGFWSLKTTLLVYGKGRPLAPRKGF